MLIQQLLSLKKTSGEIGFEIEVEGDNLPEQNQVSKFWRREVDGSLRGESGEYVFLEPLPVIKVHEALAELTSAFSKNASNIRDTYRAGIHVHINVQELTPIQLLNFVCLYYIFEQTLLEFCHKSRQGNHFCLRSSDAGFILDRLYQAALEENLNLLNTEDIRYASINLTSLFKYGSVEFRSLESTTDFDKVQTWVGVLHWLKEKALTFSSPEELLGENSVLGYDNFSKELLGPFYKQFKRHCTQENITEGVRSVQFIVYAKDWKKKDHNIFRSKSLFTS